MQAMTNKIIAHYGSTPACIKGGVQDGVQELSCTLGVQYKNPIYQYIKMPINCTQGCTTYIGTIIAPRVQDKDSHVRKMSRKVLQNIIHKPLITPVVDVCKRFRNLQTC